MVEARTNLIIVLAEQQLSNVIAGVQNVIAHTKSRAGV